MMSSPTSRFDPRAATLAATWILFLLAALLIVIRCHVRRFLTKNWGFDDTSIVVALVFMLIGAILVVIMTVNGLGVHVKDLANPTMDSLALLKYNTFLQMDTVICTFVTKVSISIYILRIRNNKRIRIILQVSMAFMFLATLAVVIVVSLTCVPLKKLWTPSVNGRCIPRSTAYSVAYVQSAFCIIIDILLTASPIAILWNVRIKPWKKVRICFLMSLGLSATFCNAIRNYLQRELTVDDFTYVEVPVIVVVILEHSLGVIAACIPACMPFFHSQKNQRLWYSLSSPNPAGSERHEFVMDARSGPKISGVPATNNGKHKAVVLNVPNPIQSSSAESAELSENENLHPHLSAEEENTQWPMKN